MELYNLITNILTDKGVNKYAEYVAEADMIDCGMNVRLLECDKYVRKYKILIKENNNDRTT
jgi:uncharacterized OB-fold protein